MLLLTVIFMDLLTGMEFDLFVPSFPQLQQVFGLSSFWVEALLSANFAGYCLSLFFVGDLADRYGRKPIIVLGLLLFIVGSLFCLGTTAYPLFLVGRFLQGMGVAAPAILSFLIIADNYSLEKQQFWIAMLNGSMNMAVAIAPVIGSYLSLYFNWQGNFVALLALGMVVLALTLIFIPNYPLAAQAKTFSWKDYRLIFGSKPLLLLIVNLFMMFAPYWIFVGLAPLLYMEDLGVSLAAFGFYQGALALVFAFGSIGYGLLIRKHKHSRERMIFWSVQIFILSFIILALVTFLNSTNALWITLAFMPFIIGQIIPTTILYPLAINFIRKLRVKWRPLFKGAGSYLQR